MAHYGPLSKQRTIVHYLKLRETTSPTSYLLTTYLYDVDRNHVGSYDFFVPGMRLVFITCKGWGW